MEREQMNIVIVGHVDHGKSTIIGRLLADTQSLPEGKLESIKAKCERESKTFEYAFLLDALKDEQNQGITIDSARCFFHTQKRDYIIIDAPGHIEFLKNMISGAARAEAALLVIDAQEGIRENSKRHGYMLSMLGIKQISIAVNKMDLVGYDENRYDEIVKEYSQFLEKINITPKEFIPCSAVKGDNIESNTQNLSWYNGNTILDAIDSFEKEKSEIEKPFRMPVQDIYRFTQQDNRRIIAGKIESGSIDVGDKVVFLPSNKVSQISSIEEFNKKDIKTAQVGMSTGFTLAEQIYVTRGEIMCKLDEPPPHSGSNFIANIFWMGKKSAEKDKKYKLKLETKSIPAKIKEIRSVLDASNLNTEQKTQIQRHEVAEVEIECQSYIAYDTISQLHKTARFVLVDDYEIAGGGIITQDIKDKVSEIRSQVYLRETKWEHSQVNQQDRIEKYCQSPKLILITGPTEIDKKETAKLLEKTLFETDSKVYYLGIRSILRGLDSDLDKTQRKEHLRRLGEVSHILLDAGLIPIATASDLTQEEIKIIKATVSKEEIITIYEGEKQQTNGVIDLYLDSKDTLQEKVDKILELMKFQNILK